MPSTGAPKASSDVRASWPTASGSPSNPQPLRYSMVVVPSSNGRAIGGTVRSMSAPSEKPNVELWEARFERIEW